MKIVILHGTDGSPEGNWFPWLKSELEKLGHEVFVPRFPTPENQSLENWCKALREQAPFEFDGDTILIGHSCGATYILDILNQKREIPVAAAILASGFFKDLGDDFFDSLNKTFTNVDFDWDLIRGNAREVAMFQGDNDPYVPRDEAEELAQNLGVQLNLIKNGGHLNAEFGYTEFPEILETVVKITDSD